MKWDELHNGDKLYLLVPIENSKGIKYEYQESYVISIKSIFYEYNKFVSIRFKYTDGNKKRVRKEFIIPEWQNYNYCIVCEKHATWLNNKNWYGNIIMCNENPEKLNDIYKELVEYKIKEIKSIIEYQKKILKTLKNNKKKNIYEPKEIN